MKRKALGRGISALIPAREAAAKAAPSGDYFLCPIERIQHQPDQPRQYFDDARLEELAASIREQGVVQPLLVRPAQNGSFVLVAGERRWRAAQRAGLREVPVVIRNLNDKQAFEAALVENLQREDLNPVEEAEAYRRLLDEHGYTQEQLADRLGRDRSTVANSMRLLKAPRPVQEALISGALAPGHARALLSLEKPALIGQALQRVAARGLSVRQVEEMVRRMKQPPAAKATPSSNARALEDRLTGALKTRVRVVATHKDRGRIEIIYSSLDELDRLLEVLLP